MTSFLDHWTGNLGGVGNNPAHLQRVPPHLHLAARDSRDIEEVIHQSTQVGDLAFDDLVLAAPIVPLEGEQPKRRDDGGEWISQLVPEHCQELVFGLAVRRVTPAARTR